VMGRGMPCWIAACLLPIRSPCDARRIAQIVIRPDDHALLGEVATTLRVHGYILASPCGIAGREWSAFHPRPRYGKGRNHTHCVRGCSSVAGHPERAGRRAWTRAKPVADCDLWDHKPSLAGSVIPSSGTLDRFAPI
jgi:hypothetical protein